MQYIGLKYKSTLSKFPLSNNILYSYKFNNAYDIVVHPHSISIQDFTLPPTQTIANKVYFQKPDDDISPTFFLQVFNYSFWIALGAVCILGILIIFVDVYLRRNSFSHLIDKTFSIFLISKTTDSKMTVGLGLTQTILSIFMFCIAASFSAFLISKLTIQNRKLPFSSLDELMSGRTKYSPCANPYTSEYYNLLYMSNGSNLLNGKNCNKKYQDTIFMKDIQHTHLCENKYSTLIGSTVNFRKFVGLIKTTG